MRGLQSSLAVMVDNSSGWKSSHTLADTLRGFKQQLCFGSLLSFTPSSELRCYMALDKTRNLLHGHNDAHPACFTALFWVPQESCEDAL